MVVRNSTKIMYALLFVVILDIRKLKNVYQPVCKISQYLNISVTFLRVGF